MHCGTGVAHTLMILICLFRVACMHGQGMGRAEVDLWGACAGLAIMHGHPLASNPYGLTALCCTWAYLMGIVALTPFK